ncbi:hypothetical protein GGR28_002735 [Lewinella aquimaris]|uniref:Uncharacterized protein n=1 Tax=Neolewinella aquimaris TaxID=1835722 RepID=A0A840E969_9BACT|nr:hypothetical protein [Neolewinella aquimaris]
MPVFLAPTRRQKGMLGGYAGAVKRGAKAGKRHLNHVKSWTYKKARKLKCGIPDAWQLGWQKSTAPRDPEKTDQQPALL